MIPNLKRRPYERSARKFLIYPQFQLLLIGINLAILFGVMLIFWASTQNAVAALNAMGRISGVELEFYRRFLQYQSSQFNQALLFSFVVGTLVSGGLTLIISHRIAGPLVRMRRFFRMIAENGRAPGPLEFRDGDYLSDFPKIVNAAISRLEESHGESEKAPERPKLTLVKGQPDGNQGNQAA